MIAARLELSQDIVSTSTRNRNALPPLYRAPMQDRSCGLDHGYGLFQRRITRGME
jgi:hypothetical protein